MNRLLAALVLLAAMPVTAQAQVDVPTSPYAVFQMAERQGWTLRVTSNSGATVEGEVVALDQEAVDIGAQRIALADVARVDRGHRVGGGARYGMVAGAVLVATAFIVTTYVISDESDFDVSDTAPLAIAGFISGGILGGLLGSELDPGRTEWRLLWPAAAW